MLMARYNAMVSSLPIVHILILAQHIALIILPTSVNIIHCLRQCHANDIVIGAIQYINYALCFNACGPYHAADKPKHLEVVCHCNYIGP